MFLGMYYAVYLSCCAIVIALLGFILHRSGAIFLNNAFAGNHTLARAVGRLLDVGFYLLSLGYVGLSCVPDWEINDHATLAKSIIGKIGGLLILMGVGHTFNMLLLALFRQRSARPYSQGA
ncbi:MAG: hypothetical protein ABR928_02900 [Terracidiphilus sp.]|jgi:hypothetical protein